MLAQFPVTPDIEPGDYNAQSAPVLIQTTGGGWYTARWTVYEDADSAPGWELIGRDGLQLDADEVTAWFYCGDVPQMADTLGDCVRLLESDTVRSVAPGYEEAAEMVLASSRALALIARVGGAQ